MRDFIVDRFYTKVGLPILIVAMRFLARFNPKIAEGLKMREPQQGVDPWLSLPAHTQPIWIHCASGEFEYAKPVIQRLKKLVNIPILVTYFSPSIRKAVASFPAVDMSCPLPWDRKEDWQKFFDHHQPRVLLVARTDTWPEMLKQSRLHKVPSLLFSATLVSNSGRARGLSKILSRHVFANLDEIFCVSSEDKKLFDQLGCRDKTTVGGDTRYDQVLERLRKPKPLSPFITTSEIPTLVAGSTWPEDEEVIVSALAGLRGKLRSILVPHEPHLDHIKDLEKLITHCGLSVDRLSKLDSSWSSDVLVVDQVGILAELYQLGDFAFVGGSFKKTVHSVMEPLATGCPTLVGPLHTNNREAIAFQKVSSPLGLPCVLVAANSKDFSDKLNFLCELRPSILKESKEFIRDEIIKRSQKSDLVVAWVQNHLS